jgi:hypothetical protein
MRTVMSHFYVIVKSVIYLIIIRGSNQFQFERMQKKPPTIAASDTEKFSDETCISDMNDRLCEFDMAEVAGTFAHLLVACLAPETWIDDTQGQVHEALRVRKPVVIIGICPYDLRGTRIPDFSRG